MFVQIWKYCKLLCIGGTNLVKNVYKFYNLFLIPLSRKCNEDSSLDVFTNNVKISKIQMRNLFLVIKNIKMPITYWDILWEPIFSFLFYYLFAIQKILIFEMVLN